MKIDPPREETMALQDCVAVRCTSLNEQRVRVISHFQVRSGRTLSIPAAIASFSRFIGGFCNMVVPLIHGHYVVGHHPPTPVDAWNCGESQILYPLCFFLHVNTCDEIELIK